MTILQLISSEGYYGAESMLLALARSLPPLGCRSVVGVFDDARKRHTEIGERAALYGLRVETVPCAGRWDRKAVIRIRELLAMHEVDVLHTHGYKADMYGWKAARAEGVALVATCHNWAGRRFKMRAYAALDRLVLGRFDRVATASEAVAGVLRRWRVPGGKLATIPNGVDLERFAGAAPALRPWISKGRRRVIGFVGRMVPEKGGELLLRSAKAILRTHPDVTFVMVGEGPARSTWEALAAELGISAHVVFTGTRKDMPELYASLDMLVLPSFNECMPMCLLEAMASGKPVIASRVGAVEQVIVPESTGLLIGPGDGVALEESIGRLLRDPALAARLGHAGRERVTGRFSSEVVAESYLGLYRQAVKTSWRRDGLESAWSL
jgi:glycosyltransferase involved in cell wall biosynthesis